jgi:hypothetical protein
MPPQTVKPAVSLVPPNATPSAPAVVVAEAATVERIYVVERDFKVPNGASSFTLRQGKVLSSKGYDIDHLLRVGAPIKPV